MLIYRKNRVMLYIQSTDDLILTVQEICCIYDLGLR